MSLRILLTGATGFIGGRLAGALVRERYSVSAIVRKTSRVERLQQDIGAVNCHAFEGNTEQLIEIVDRCRPGLVIHLASCFVAEHRPCQVEELVTANLLFPTQLLEAMAANEVTRLINTGSVWQYYGNRGYDPLNLYAATKQAFVDMACYYRQVRGLRTLTLVLSDTYGPDDPRPKLVNLLVDAHRQRRRLPMGSGRQIIDLVHIDDVVAAYLGAVKSFDELADPDGTYSIRSDRPLTVRQLVETFARLCGGGLETAWGQRPDRERELLRPVDTVPRLPDWQPQIDLRDGLRQLLEQAK